MQSIFNSFSLVIIKVITKFVRKISTKLVITKIKRGYFSCFNYVFNIY